MSRTEPSLLGDETTRFLSITLRVMKGRLTFFNWGVSYSNVLVLTEVQIPSVLESAGQAFGLGLSFTFTWKLEMKTIQDLIGELKSFAGNRKAYSNFNFADVENFCKTAYQKYHSGRRKKKQGGTRPIDKPFDDLKACQSLVKEILSAHYTPPDCVYGVKRSNPRKNAQLHQDSDYLIIVDLKSFYERITREQVMSALQLYCSNEVAEVLCDICYKKNRLPQGSPASPIIANMVCRHLDKTLSQWCDNRTPFDFISKALKSPSTSPFDFLSNAIQTTAKKFQNTNYRYRFEYSRYVDDLVISIPRHRRELWPKSLPVFEPEKLPKEVCKTILAEIQKHGFSVNYKKIRISSRSNRQAVNNITVNQKINVSSGYIKSVRTQLFILEKKNPLSSIKEFEQVEGKLNHIKHVRGSNAKDEVYNKLAAKLDAIKSKRAPFIKRLKEFQNLHEDLLGIHYLEWRFGQSITVRITSEKDVDRFLKKLNARSNYALEKLGHFASRFKSIDEAEQCLVYIFDMWHKFHYQKFTRNGERVITPSATDRQVGKSVFPSAFMLGHKIWVEVIIREIEDCLSWNGNTYLDLKLHEFGFAEINNIQTTLQKAKRKHGAKSVEFYTVQNKLAKDYCISEAHAHAILLDYGKSAP